ncbi:MAG: DUF2059 domain-containing protein [Mesorhizobium sp.]
MMLHKPARRLFVAVAASAMFALSSPAFSQEASETHLQAARAAIAAIHATDSFDGILPGAASALEQQLIQKNPDLQALITSTVSEKALALAARRSDLEKEAALAYAKVFSEQDLKAIAAFYESDAGKKLLTDGPKVSAGLVKAADIWQNGIARDLAQQVGEALQKAVGSTAPAAPAPEAAPAEDSGN